MTDSLRVCGDCSLCCLLLHVPEVNKPKTGWCQHCRPGQGGCSIYEKRPPVCRRYACLWLDGTMPDYWQPDQSKIVLDLELSRERGILRVVVHPDYSDRWREEPYYQDIKMMVRKFKQTLILRPRKATIYLEPDLDIETQLQINYNDRKRLNPEFEIEEDEDEALYRAWNEAVLDDILTDQRMKEVCK
jgi:hypothetical protein